MLKLNEMQQSFVINYIKNGFNATQAALKAGYSDSYARTNSDYLVNTPAIKERITKALNKIDRKIEISFEYRMKKLRRIIDDFIPDDKKIELSPLKVKTALQAMAEINKMYGDYAPDKQLKVTVDMTHDKLKDIKKQYEEY